MEIITKKSEINIILKNLRNHKDAKNPEFFKEFDNQVLSKKIKFPLLELIALEMHSYLPPENHYFFLEKVAELKRMGSNVIIGKLLQLKLKEHPIKSLNTAISYIVFGNSWYATDIIAERVLGHCLLLHPKIGIKELDKLSLENSSWKVRAVGVGIHYAVKKNLELGYVKNCFEILLKLANSKDYQIKRGIGWAAKTTAKFHPEFVKNRLKSFDGEMGQWFKTKINIGLNYKPKSERNKS